MCREACSYIVSVHTHTFIDMYLCMTWRKDIPILLCLSPFLWMDFFHKTNLNQRGRICRDVLDTMRGKACLSLSLSLFLSPCFFFLVCLYLLGAANIWPFVLGVFFFLTILSKYLGRKLKEFIFLSRCLLLLFHFVLVCFFSIVSITKFAFRLYFFSNF